ncbi:MAG: hypothetical protein NVS3B5_14090 [Sphingomicrobium sp.]
MIKAHLPGALRKTKRARISSRARSLHGDGSSQRQNEFPRDGSSYKLKKQTNAQLGSECFGRDAQCVRLSRGDRVGE